VRSTRRETDAFFLASPTAATEKPELFPPLDALGSDEAPARR
jgi:hypothetical protein